MKRLFAAACCAALLAMSVEMVCPAAEMTDVSAEKKTAEEKKQIGEKEKGAQKSKLTNASGKDIKAFAIKAETEEEFTENLLAEEDVFADGEMRIFYYVPESELESEAAEPESEEENEEANYVIQLTFADDTTAELHAFVFSKMKKARICLEENTAYLVYKDGKEKVSTLEAEQELAEETMGGGSRVRRLL